MSTDKAGISKIKLIFNRKIVTVQCVVLIALGVVNLVPRITKNKVCIIGYACVLVH